MQIGKWVPIDKRLSKFLPKTRTFTELEAAFSFSIDYDNENKVTVSGYAKLWGWSRTKVKSFFDEMGVCIIYPGDTQKTQKQKGQIEKQKENRKETEKRQIRFIDSKWLGDSKSRKKTEKKQKKDRSKTTTSDPSLKPNPEPDQITAALVEEIFNFWALTMGKKKSILTEERKKAVTGRLKEGYTVNQIKESIIGCSKDSFSMGQNKRQKKFDDLELICRSGKKLESFFTEQVSITSKVVKKESKSLSSAERITQRLKREPEQFEKQIKKIN